MSKVTLILGVDELVSAITEVVFIANASHRTRVEIHSTHHVVAEVVGKHNGTIARNLRHTFNKHTRFSIF